MFGGLTTGGWGTDSIKRVWESISAFLATKLDLIGIELQEEKRRVLELLILLAAALLFGALALTVLTFTVIVLFWDHYRFEALFAISLVYALISGFLFMRLRCKAHSATKVFETTVEELKKDVEWVNDHL